METIGRGTTPLLKFKIPRLQDITVEQIWITFTNPNTGVIFNITKDDVDIDGQYVSFRLTQEQTLEFKNNSIFWQIRLLDTGGVAYISGPPKQIDILPILKEGVIQ